MIYKYNRKIKYLDDDVSGVKPKHLLQRTTIYTSRGDPIQDIWDRDWKITRETFGRKRKPTGFIYLPGSKFREAKDYLSMRLCLKYAIINYAIRIGKYINKLKLYRQWPPRRVKDTKISKIENTSCVRNVMRVNPVSGIEREPWGAACIMRKVNYGV